jgi:hypothetical protein
MNSKQVAKELLKLAKEFTAGLESMVDRVLSRRGWRPGEDFYWEDGLVVDDPRNARKIVKDLNDSGEFGEATFERRTSKIKFAPYRR